MTKAASERAYERAVPKLAELGDKVLYGQVWEEPELTKRDRSLITIAALLATHRPEQLRAHIKRGLQNGLSTEEIAGLIVHLAFYAGWPAAVTAGEILRAILDGEDR